MTIMKIGLLAALLAAGCSNKSSRHDPDNSGRNADPVTYTNGDHAPQSGADLDLTQNIRKAIVADSTLSTNAHNCKIVVSDGVATLLGPVSDETEKARVVQLATDAGASKVIDQLEVVKSTANR
jgi:osmotically-inducible protein OsmY